MKKLLWSILRLDLLKLSLRVKRNISRKFIFGVTKCGLQEFQKIIHLTNFLRLFKQTF